MWNKLDKKQRRLLNCLLYTIMTPVGFLLGWYMATEQWMLVMAILAFEMIMEFVLSYTYLDLIGDRFGDELEKAPSRGHLVSQG